MTDFNSQFYNPENELNLKYANEIHMHRINRGARKCDIIMTGLMFKDKDDTKKFLSQVKNKFGINGCNKMMEEYDKTNKVFVFTGDKRDEIKNLLISEYGKEDEFIKYYG